MQYQPPPDFKSSQPYAPPALPQGSGSGYSYPPQTSGQGQTPPYSLPPAPMQYVGYQAVSPKNPLVMLPVSFFIPGLGTILNGETGKGVLILVGYYVSLLLALVLMLILIGFFLLPIPLGLWIFGMVDGYQGAQRHNLAHGFPSGG
jgi:hypothetical protein